MTSIDKLIAIAKAEEGYLEKKTNEHLDDKSANAGNNNWTKYARDMDALGVYNGRKNGYAWCDMFVDWCFVRAFGLSDALKLTCQKMGGVGAGCTGSANYYKAQNKFFRSNPKVGDQIFFTEDSGKTMYHTGLVVAIDQARVHTVEGNTSSLAGVVPNGGCVRCKSYALTYNKIGGYGRPDFTIIKEEPEMTKEQLKAAVLEVINELKYKTVLDVPTSYKPSVLKVMQMGAMSGYDAKDPSTLNDNVINVDETFCRVLTVLDKAGIIKELSE